MQGRRRVKKSGGQTFLPPLPFPPLRPSPFLPLPFPPSLPPSLLPLPLEVASLNPARVWGSAVRYPSGGIYPSGGKFTSSPQKNEIPSPKILTEYCNLIQSR